MVAIFIGIWVYFAKQALKDHQGLPHSRYKCAAPGSLGLPCWPCRSAGSHSAVGGAGARLLTRAPASSLCSTHLPVRCRDTYIFIRVQMRVVGPVQIAILLTVLLQELVPTLSGSCIGQVQVQMGAPSCAFRCWAGREARPIWGLRHGMRLDGGRLADAHTLPALHSLPLPLPLPLMLQTTWRCCCR